MPLMSRVPTRVSLPIPPQILDLTLTSIPVMIGIFAGVMRMSDYVLSGSFFRAANLSSCCETFDFIVVGGGSAGAAIAARLSEDPKIKVLLLEVGGDPNPYTYLPTAVPKLQNHPMTDWEFKTVPQKDCALSSVNQEIQWPRGKSLGGSSNINFMIYMRGNRHDFDRWARHTNDSRWRYENVEKYFRKMEDYKGVWDGNGHHGKGGPLRVEGVRYKPGLNHVLDAAKEVGYDIRDLNADQKPGFSPMDMTMKRGLRFSTFRAYIRPNERRRNLVIYRYSHVTKIHFDKNRRATGVTFFRHGVKGYASASKEIIVSCGAVGSPHLLMLSGIGPREDLIQHRISPIADLPVGKNLVDHVTTSVGPFILNDSISFMLHRDVDSGAIFNLLKQGTGPLTSPLGIMAVGMHSTSLAPAPLWPDVMLTVVSLGVFQGLPEIIDDLFNTGTTGQKFLSPDLGKDSHFVLVTLGLPESRGYIRLQDGNPYSKPVINPQYYSDPGNLDIRRMTEGVMQVIRMYESTSAFRKFGAHLSRSFPGCEKVPFKSDKYSECLIRTFTQTLYHPTSTCRMGKVDDPDSVVDSELRVIGVKGLRVADASVMPFITNANTNAPTIAIGEICADMIKAEWKLKAVPKH